MKVVFEGEQEREWNKLNVNSVKFRTGDLDEIEKMKVSFFMMIMVRKYQMLKSIYLKKKHILLLIEYISAKQEKYLVEIKKTY